LQPVLALDLNAKDQNGRTPLDWSNVVIGPDPKELKETRDPSASTAARRMKN